MAHELDFSKGQAAIAFRGAVPWHGLGESILPQDSIDDIRIKAGLDYDVVKTPVQYQQTFLSPTLVPDNDPPIPESITKQSNDHCVLYRNDTGSPLSVVSPKYQVVQPKEVVEFYRDLTEKFGYELEVVGALKGGKKVWALANTGNSLQLRDRDDVKGYLLLATSYDGTMATQARFTSIRVVCNNTLTLAANEGRADVTVPHSTKFDADKVKQALGIGVHWQQFSDAAREMQNRIVSRDETIRFLMDAYYSLSDDEAIKAHQADESKAKSTEKFIERLTKALFESPGAQLASARGTLWGALQAVTFDVDHQLPSRTADSRLDKAWFGSGNAIKQRAWNRALSMVG